MMNTTSAQTARSASDSIDSRVARRAGSVIAWLTSLRCTGKASPDASENTARQTIVPASPSGMTEASATAISTVSTSTTRICPKRASTADRAAPATSNTVVAAISTPNQCSGRCFDSRIGWKRLACPIRTSVKIAMPCAISSISRFD